jgi:hypothetical protein
MADGEFADLAWVAAQLQRARDIGDRRGELALAGGVLAAFGDDARLELHGVSPVVCSPREAPGWVYGHPRIDLAHPVRIPLEWYPTLEALWVCDVVERFTRFAEDPALLRGVESRRGYEWGALPREQLGRAHQQVRRAVEVWERKVGGFDLAPSSWHETLRAARLAALVSDPDGVPAAALHEALEGRRDTAWICERMLDYLLGRAPEAER